MQCYLIPTQYLPPNTLYRLCRKNCLPVWVVIFEKHTPFFELAIFPWSWRNPTTDTKEKLEVQKRDMFLQNSNPDSTSDFPDFPQKSNIKYLVYNIRCAAYDIAYLYF